ncbi:hypothetical protein BESB_071400 [Besnoitia besnoiti]|uniref:Transmembrane protein n=1 Tax=Besnoitia besnoiti TaxID=94643 RepID=A0A2A9M689_BESBE|nr:uncharacterized protein BESB_071400 [Besnoitia besnoiti]PFH33988.1 hypothetical protein BESB_071400 [Besnoitia besnoiti]
MGNMCAICFRPGKESGCACFSLSIAIFIFAVYYGAVGGLDFWQAVNSVPELVTQKYNAIFTLSVAGALALSVLLGFLRLGFIAFIFTLAVFLLQLADALFKLVTFVLNWVDWGTALNNGTMKFQSAMISSTISQLLTIGITFAMANVMYSAALVYKAGGTGCEFKNYQEIQDEKEKQKAPKADEEA